MNNKDLRTLADRVQRKYSDPEAVLLAGGVKRLLDENKKLSELLADEILDGAATVPAEVRILDLPPTPSDVPDGFQEVIPNDED